MGCWKTLDEAVEQLNHQKAAKLFSAYNTLIRECGNSKSLCHARKLQEHMISTGYDRNQVLGDLLVQMYGQCGSLDDAQSAFDKLPSRKPSSWNNLLRAYALQKQSQGVIAIFHKMVSLKIHFDGLSLAGVLAACSRTGDLEQGSAAHEQATKSGLGNNISVRKALVNMYGKCRALDRAEQVFNSSERREVGLWNGMIAAYAQNGRHRQALELYKRMDLEPNVVTISSVLALCSTLGELEEGRSAYARGKHLRDVFVESAAVNMFGKCGELELARSIFDAVEQKNLVTWNSMLVVYVQHGRNRDALELYEKMGNLRPSSSVYATVIQACAGLQDLRKGMEIHARIVEQGIRQSPMLQTSLMNMYGKLGRVDLAREVFEEMEDKSNIVAYNVMISSLAQQGLGTEALELYGRMIAAGIQPDSATYCSALGGCLSPDDLSTGRAIHEAIVSRTRSSAIQWESRVYNALVSMYGRCRDVESAKRVFDGMDQQGRDSVSWNAMICAFAKNGRSREAIDLFHDMIRRDHSSDSSPSLLSEMILSTVLHACSLVGELEEGRRIHRMVSRSTLRSSIEVNISLLKMYSECGRLDVAERIFREELVHRANSAGPWCCMVAVYGKHGRGWEALRTLQGMQLQGWKPEPVTMGTVLSSCESLAEGMKLHATASECGLDRLRSVQDGLMNMYSLFGELELAREVFEGMEVRTVVSWTIIISAYDQQGRAREALELYHRMDVEPDDILYAMVFGACATLGDMALGDSIRRKLKNSDQLGVFGATGLLNMYAKCGAIEKAREVFEGMGYKRSFVSWTAIISAYSQELNSKSSDAFDEAGELCERMVQEGVMPDGVTFISLVIANGGRLERSLEQWRRMVWEYGLDAGVDQYECLIEVVSRAGWIVEAEAIAGAMPFEAGAVTWTTLLGACGVHGEFEVGRRVAGNLIEMGSRCSSSYVLLSRLVAAVEGDEAAGEDS